MIEADGIETKPLLIDSLEIFAGTWGRTDLLIVGALMNVRLGQRYSVIVRQFPTLKQERVPHLL